MRAFFAWAFKQMIKKQGDKFGTHQRRYYKDYSNRGKQVILYGPVGLELEGTGLNNKAQAFLQKHYVEKYLKKGYNRSRAIFWATEQIRRRFSKA